MEAREVGRRTRTSLTISRLFVVAIHAGMILSMLFATAYLLIAIPIELGLVYPNWKPGAFEDYKIKFWISVIVFLVGPLILRRTKRLLKDN